MTRHSRPIGQFLKDTFSLAKPSTTGAWTAAAPNLDASALPRNVALRRAFSNRRPNQTVPPSPSRPALAQWGVRSHARYSGQRQRATLLPPSRPFHDFSQRRADMRQCTRACAATENFPIGTRARAHPRYVDRTCGATDRIFNSLKKSCQGVLDRSANPRQKRDDVPHDPVPP